MVERRSVRDVIDHTNEALENLKLFDGILEGIWESFPHCKFGQDLNTSNTGSKAILPYTRRSGHVLLKEHLS